MSGALPIVFDPASLIMLNVIMALMMFGVSLTLRLEDFKRIILAPIAPIAGLFAQIYLGIECRSRSGVRDDFGGFLSWW